eukprot:9468814-Pyramimonas_sp.AAC.1
MTTQAGPQDGARGPQDGQRRPHESPKVSPSIDQDSTLKRPKETLSKHPGRFEMTGLYRLRTAEGVDTLRQLH